MGTQVGPDPVRPNDCADFLVLPCVADIDNLPECQAIGGAGICPGTQSSDRGANINPRYCTYTFVSANFVHWIPPNDCLWLGTWKWTQCSDDAA